MAKKMDDPMEAMRQISDMQHLSLDIKVGDDITITLRSLGAKDETETFVDCMHLWGQAFICQHKIETLARAIVKVNGQSFGPVEDSGPDIDYLTPERKILKLKRDIIGRWHQSLVDDLYRKYANLMGDVDQFMEKVKVSSETNVVGAKKAEEEAKEVKQ